MSEGLKRCPGLICKGQMVPVSRFGSSKWRKDGLRNYCRQCEAARQRQRELGYKAQNEAAEKVEVFEEAPPETFEYIGEVVRPEQVEEGRPRCAVLLFDVHRDEVAFQFWTAILFFLQDLHPDLIILGGDALDMQSSSRHVSDADAPNITEDLDWGRLLLRELKHASPTSKTIWLEGNHEDALSRYLASAAPRARGLASIDDVCKEGGAIWVPQLKQPYAFGSLDLIHSHQQFRIGAPKHHAAKMVEVYGRPGRTVVYGHTHKAQTFEAPGLGGNRRAVGLGAVRSLNPGWLKGQEAGWSNEFAVAYQTTKATHLHVIRWDNGEFSWGPKIYRGDSERYGRTFGFLSREVTVE